MPWIGHTNAYRHPTHYRYFNEDYFPFFNTGYPGREHLSIQLWSRWQVLRSEIVDQCHVYGILKCLRYTDKEDLVRTYGTYFPCPPSASWMFQERHDG